MEIQRSLSDVRARVEAALAQRPGSDTADPQTQLELLEELLIQVLDSEFCDYPDGVLLEYLETYRYLRQLELNLIPFPDPREE